MSWLLLYPLVGLIVFPVLFHLELKRESVKGLGHATALFGATLVLWPIFVVLVPHAQRRDRPKEVVPISVTEAVSRARLGQRDTTSVYEPQMRMVEPTPAAPSRNGYPEAPKPEPVVERWGIESKLGEPKRKFATGGHVKMMVPDYGDWFMPPTVTELEESARYLRDLEFRAGYPPQFSRGGRVSNIGEPSFSWEQAINDDWHIEETIDERRICDADHLSTEEWYEKMERGVDDEVQFRARDVMAEREKVALLQEIIKSNVSGTFKLNAVTSDRFKL